MKNIAFLIGFQILYFLSASSYAQGNKSGGDAGACFASILTKSKRNIPITDSMAEFFNKNLPIYKKIYSVAGGKCKGLEGTPANEPCFRSKLTPYEFDWYVGFGSATFVINGPQDPSKLPNLEVMSFMCTGLVK